MSRRARSRPGRAGLSFLVSQVGAHAAQTFGRDLVPLELTPQHVGILRLLATSDEPLTQRDLAERLRVLPSRLVALLDALEQRRFLGRKIDPEDRRRKRLRLTAEGHEAFENAEVVRRALDERLFGGLSVVERTTLLGLLERVAEDQGLVPGVHPAYQEIED